jgi:CRP/FNR family cyclic AMP-dependent transcriptional regulator
MDAGDRAHLRCKFKGLASPEAASRAGKVSDNSMFENQHLLHSNHRTRDMAREPVLQEERVELLSRIPLFCELSRRELHKLADAAMEHNYPAGTAIIRQGETEVGFYVLISGRALFQQRLAGGSNRELATLGRGGIFGEMALLDIFPRSASVMALEETSALVIPIFEFRALLYDDSDIAMKLLAELSRRVRTAESAASS